MFNYLTNSICNELKPVSTDYNNAPIVRYLCSFFNDW